MHVSEILKSSHFCERKNKMFYKKKLNKTKARIIISYDVMIEMHNKGDIL